MRGRGGVRQSVRHSRSVSRVITSAPTSSPTSPVALRPCCTHPPTHPPPRQFYFLKPTHSLFGFFTALADAYSAVLMPDKELHGRLAQDASDRCAAEAKGSGFEGLVVVLMPDEEARAAGSGRGATGVCVADG